MKYTPEQKTKAYELYISSKLTLKEIAKQTAVKYPTLQQWIDVEKWSSKKKSLVKSSLDSVDNGFLTFINANRLDTAKRQLEMATDLSESIHAKFKVRPDGTKPFLNENQLLKLSQALKNSTDVEAKASGLDRPLPNESMMVNQKGPLILVGLQANPIQPAKSEPIPIDVEVCEPDPF